jgi:hypothetical protein
MRFLVDNKSKICQSPVKYINFNKNIIFFFYKFKYIGYIIAVQRYFNRIVKNY